MKQLQGGGRLANPNPNSNPNQVRASASDAALAVCSARWLSEMGAVRSERTKGGAAPLRAASTKYGTASGFQPPAAATAACENTCMPGALKRTMAGRSLPRRSRAESGNAAPSLRANRRLPLL